MEFRQYTENDYDAVCEFLIDLNRNDTTHINWNWARFEWMAGHPDFDRSLTGSIGLWTRGEKVVGAAIYDMYFGEAFCGALPEHPDLYPEILAYACRELRDDTGLAVAVCDDAAREIETVKALGFVPIQQTETVMTLALDRHLSARLPEGYRVRELDPGEELPDFQWLLWQGFDHGEDRAEFERTEQDPGRARRHFNRHLSLTATDAAGEKAAYCCLWVYPGTDYAYVEPVCTVPVHRGKGLARALICEAAHRAAALGAKRAYVISDMAFYEKLGFRKDRRFTFYRRA